MDASRQSALSMVEQSEPSRQSVPLKAEAPLGVGNVATPLRALSRRQCDPPAFSAKQIKAESQGMLVHKLLCFF